MRLAASRRVRTVGAAVVAAGLACAGCVSVLPEAGPAPNVYRLGDSQARANALHGLAAFSATTGWVIVVPTPIASRALNTDRVAVVTDRGSLSYAAGARWEEAAPRMVQESVIARIEADSRFAAAVRPEDGIDGAFELRLDVRRFEAVYADGDNAAPTVRVSVRARLVRRDGRALEGTARFEAAERADANRIGAIVDAFDAALAQVADELAPWILAAGRAQPDEPASEPAVEPDAADDSGA